MLTTLAIVFVLALVGTIFYGFSLIMKRPPSEEELHTERCSICRRRFAKEVLLERSVGDYNILYFCLECVQGLAEESKLIEKT